MLRVFAQYFLKQIDQLLRHMGRKNWLGVYNFLKQPLDLIVVKRQFARNVRIKKDPGTPDICCPGVWIAANHFRSSVRGRAACGLELGMDFGELLAEAEINHAGVVTGICKNVFAFEIAIR
jgi:hypothetical protein